MAKQIAHAICGWVCEEHLDQPSAVELPETLVSFMPIKKDIAHDVGLSRLHSRSFMK